MNPNSALITGVVCGVRVEDVADPLMQKIRYLDKLIDELARGKKMASILREAVARGHPAFGAKRQRRPARTRTARKPTTIDEYLATVSGARLVALERLRKTIRSIIPDAEECISYNLPAFRLDGVVVAGFCATAKGCSYFPFSGKTLETLAPALEGYERTKGSLHFSPDKPLPATLVRRLIRARIAEAKK
jgi:uncharacterized protein YdhG (YjbR/CyaY superfamily)